MLIGEVEGASHARRPRQTQTVQVQYVLAKISIT